ncbi:MAG: hypothetical protein NUW09_04195 [Deltaproteobacteria bacterium]|nr:hypothetical protein [Deltaproteobacteria bacterium]
MVGLLPWLGSALASIIGYSAVRFVAWKVVLYTLLVTVVPIILVNFVFALIQGALSLSADAQAQYGVSPVIVQLAGLGAWLAQRFRIVEGFSLIFSAMMFRVAVRMIPFIRL